MKSALFAWTVVAATGVMKPVSRSMSPKTDLVPSTNVAASFISNVQSLVPTTALVHLTTKQPTIVLENVGTIQQVQCQDGSVSVTFASAVDATNARVAWVSESKLAFWISHTVGCFGEAKVAAVAISDIKTDGPVLVATALQLPISEFVVDYELQVNQPSQSLKDVVDLEHVEPVALNYDDAAKSAKTSNIALISNDRVDAVCANCYSHGNAGIRLYLKTDKGIVTNYKISMDGNINANVDMKLQVKKGDNKNMIFRTSVASFDLSPISVPGLFSLGPSVNLDVGVSFKMGKRNDVLFGFDAALPYSFSVGSDEGILAKPVFTHSADFKTVEHPITSSAKDLNFDLAIHGIPSARFGLEVLGSFLLGGILELDSAVGAVLTPCSASKVDVDLYHEHGLDFIFKVLATPSPTSLWKSGRLDINCSFCTQCAA